MEEEEEKLKDAARGAPVAEVEDIRRWSTRRAKRAPGTPFSWETCDKTKVVALPQSHDQEDASQRPEDLQEMFRRISDARTILVLLLATALLPAIF